MGRLRPDGTQCVLLLRRRTGTRWIHARSGRLGEYIAMRLAQMEAQVAAEQRDARSLVAIPAHLALSAKVTFPKDAFGAPEPW